MAKPQSLKKVFVIASQHLDVAWLWERKPHGEELMREVFERAIELAEANPGAGFIMSRSTAWGYSLVEKKYPQLFTKIQKAVADGVIELSGGQWVEPDNAAPSGESFIRQSLYGQTYFYTRFGKTAKVAWNPDVFMQGNTLPQLMLKTGLEGYYFHRCRPLDANGNPIFQFIWEGPDGSKVYCFTGNWYDYPNDEVMDAICETAKQQSLPADYIVTARGSDRKITARKEWLDVPAKQKNKYALDVCKWAGANDVLNEMKTYRDKLPVIKGDLGGYLYTGTYTSDQIAKRRNRKLENELAAAEFVNSFNYLSGGVYYYNLLAQAWQDLCVNQFHDIMCGTCFKSVQNETYELYDEVEKKTNLGMECALDEFRNRIKTNHVQGVPYVILNPSPSPVQDAAGIEINGCAPVEIYSSTGEKIISQTVERDGNKKALFIPPKQVPGYGVDVVYVRETGSCLTEYDRDLVLENEFVRVEFDSVTGVITSFYDKQLKFEFFKNGSFNNSLDFLEDKNNIPCSPVHYWDPWNIKLTGGKYYPHGAYRVYVLESGPVCKTIRMERTVSLWPDTADTVVFQDITLYKNSAMLHIKCYGDWQAREAMLKAEFNFSFESPVVVCDMPYGVIERSSVYDPKANQPEEPDRPMQMWLDFSDGKTGMAFFNNGICGYDSTEKSIRLSLMRAPLMRENEVTGLGVFSFSYALLPHAGTWKDAGIPSKSYCFNRELIVKQAWPHDGAINTLSALFAVDRESVIITAVKRAELSNDIIVRLYESKGEKTDTILTSLFNIKSACEVNAIEMESLNNLAVSGGHRVDIKMGPFEVKTLRLCV